MTAQETKEKIINGELYPLVNDKINWHDIMYRADFILDNISFTLMITTFTDALDTQGLSTIITVSISFDNNSYYEIYETIGPHRMDYVYLTKNKITIPITIKNKTIYEITKDDTIILVSSDTEPFNFYIIASDEEGAQMYGNIKYAIVEENSPIHGWKRMNYFLDKDGNTPDILCSATSIRYGCFVNEI